MRSLAKLLEFLLRPLTSLHDRLVSFEKARLTADRRRGKHAPGEWVKVVAIRCEKCAAKPADSSGLSVQPYLGKVVRISRYDDETDEYVINAVVDDGEVKSTCDYIHAAGLVTELQGDS